MSDKRLADAVVALLESLEDQGAIERCHHHGCRRLAAGLPDFGPRVEAAVCGQHVPHGAALIPSLEDTADALRAVLKKLARYGHRFDLETGKRATEEGEAS